MVTQGDAHCYLKPPIIGSNPISGQMSIMFFAVVAQLVEHRPSKSRVAGSNPVYRSKLIKLVVGSTKGIHLQQHPRQVRIVGRLHLTCNQDR